jgi:hypothetical protein
MTLDERVYKVCSKDSRITRSNKMLVLAKKRVHNIKQSLERGYKIHQSCKQIAIEVPDYFTCGYNGIKGLSACKRSGYTKTEYRTDCTEMPVSIDVSLERSQLLKYQKVLDTAIALNTVLKEKCHSKIGLMSAKEAFEYYEK